jgi:hypothetical protein
LTLLDLVPPGIFVGTSLILRQGDRFLYGMRPAKEEQGRMVIELTGIGGGVEEGDRSYEAGVRREAVEEVASDVELIPCRQSLVVRGETELERITLEGPERPAAVVFRNYRTPAHRPWDERNSGQGCLIVYLADLKCRPWPVSELPWLMWLSPEQVLQTARQDVALDALIEAGATLVTGRFDPPVSGSWVRLTDSQEALGIALGDQLPAFYRSLGR